MQLNSSGSLVNKQTIKFGMKALAAADPDVAAALVELGEPPPRLRPAGFETFLSTIISQQISISAAAAIKQRCFALLTEISPQALLAIDDESLRAAGLSYRKIDYAKGLAIAIDNGSFNVESLSVMSDEDAIHSITTLRGFGRWSAEIYLMFSLHREDIFPADDLAILQALAKLKRLDKKPTPKEARQIIEHWQPWRSVGALFLWHYYHGAPQ